MHYLLGWMKAPMLQFLLLGCVIFAADQWFNGDRDADSQRILISRQHMDALRAGFQQEHGRLPTDEELSLRLKAWIDEQVLYRQALTLGLEQNDAIVRRQLVQKMRFLLEDAIPVDEPDEQALQSWLDEHPERYGQALLEKLHGQPDQPDVNRIDNVDHARLRRDFGRAFADAVMQLPDGQWQGPLQSGLGLHLVRITDRGDFTPARLADVHDRVGIDLRLHLREQANREAMDRLRRRFRIEYEDAVNSGAGG